MMNRKVSHLILFGVSCGFIQEVLNLRLESDKSVPIRGENLILSCLTTSLFDNGTIHWYNSTDVELSRCFAIKGGVCDRNTSSYSFSANSSGAYAYIKSLDRIRDGGTWKCTHLLSSYENDSNDIVIYASPGDVNVVHPTAPHGDLGEESITMSCQTHSCAFPAPNITWYYVRDGQITPYLGFSDNTVSDTSQCTQMEAIYTSTLQLPRGANFSGNIPFVTKFLCGVTHQTLGSNTSYSKASGDIKFAVQVSRVNLEDSASGTKVFYEDSPQTLSCVSSPSRPVPVIMWFLQTPYAVSNLTDNIIERNKTCINGLHVLTSEITLILKRHQRDHTIFCTAKINGQPDVASNRVEIDVLYKPDQPYVREFRAEFPWLENQTGTLCCTTNNIGNPSSKIIWTKHRGITDADGNLVLKELKPHDNGKMVYCQLVNNYTVDTNLTVISQPVTLNIEYSPIIELNTTSSLTVNETQSISVLCSAMGNPEPYPPMWIGTYNSTLRFDNISRTDKGPYVCSVQAISRKYQILSSTTRVDILVQYAPDINVTITGSDRRNMASNVTCEANGFPSKYTFHPWKHMLGEVTVRSHLLGNLESTINSSKNILTLDRLSMQDMGTYVCSADNGIRGLNGDVIQTGAVVLNIRGLPYVVNTKHDTFAGEIGLLSNMSIPFHSDPVIMDFKFQRNGSEVKNTSRTSTYLHKDIVELMFHDTKVKLEVPTANLLIHNLTQADFNGYILVLENSLGTTEFNLKLNPSGPPLMVESFYYNRFIEGGIEFHFDPGFNGGRKQTFIIEYRSLTNPEAVWSNTSVTDLQEEQTGYQFPNGTYFVNVTKPPPGSYKYRMFSENGIGRSPCSMEVSVVIPQGEKTKYHSDPFGPRVAAIAGSIVTPVVVVLGVAVTCIMMKKRLSSKKKSSGACQSMEHIHRRRYDIGAVYENSPVRDTIINPDNVYENALAVGRFGADIRDDDANVYDSGYGVDMSLLRNTGDLIYADLELAKPTTNNGKPVIHGIENRTEYAEIAFGKRGEPLVDSDDEKRVLSAEGAN